MCFSIPLPPLSSSNPVYVANCSLSVEPAMECGNIEVIQLNTGFAFPDNYQMPMTPHGRMRLYVPIPPSRHTLIFFGLSLCKSCLCCHSLCEFVCAPAVRYRRHHFFDISYYLWLLQSSHLLPQRSISLKGKG